MNTDEPQNLTKAGLKKYLYQGIMCFFVIAAAMLLFFLLFRLTQIKGYFANVMNILQPITTGLILAYLLNPIMNFFERSILNYIRPHVKSKKKIKGIVRYLSIFISLAIGALILYILGSLILPELYITIVGIVKDLPSNINSFTHWVNETTASNEILGDYLNEAIVRATQFFENWLEDDLLKQINTWAAYFATGVLNILNIVKNVIIGIIVSVYVLASKEKFCAQSKMIIYALTKENAANVIIDTVRQSNEIFGGFIVGKLIDSTIIGILCFIGLSIIGMPYTMLVSVIVGVTNIIPFFGPYIGALPSAFLILVASPIHCLYFVIFIVVLQQVDGNIIGPKILGESTGLSAFWVVFSILLAGGLFGLPGMLIGVPAFAVIYYIIKRIITHLLGKKSLRKSSNEYEEIKSIRIENGKPVYIPLESAVSWAEEMEEKKETKEKSKDSSNEKKNRK